ncbi:MAG: hypothetical protein Q9227_006233 [Pyrenula ochraceoflavens]
MSSAAKPKIMDSDFSAALSPFIWFDDSDRILAHDQTAETIYLSEDAGASWLPIDVEEAKGHSYMVWPHPYAKEKAYIVGTQGKHWVTTDRAKTWHSYELHTSSSLIHEPFSFHASDSKKVIFHSTECEGIFSCHEVTYWTDDDFKSHRTLMDDSRGCYWAAATPEFGQGLELGEKINDRIFCVARGLYSPWPKDNRLLMSDDHFEDDSREPLLADGHTVNGVIDLAHVKKYLVTAAKSEGSFELGLYISDDAEIWHRAEFGDGRLEQDAYTLLESTNYSIQVDVMTEPKTEMGAIYASNSNGTYFTKNILHTNRDGRGRVDFEKIYGIQGIYLANIVDNHEAVQSRFDEKKIVTQITFDDGRTFHDVKAGDKRLHLHAVTDMDNVGRVFSSPAPGIVMGNGNTGKFLRSKEESDLYVSDDAGVTWRQALDGPQKYEFGNQGAVLVAIDDGDYTDHISYSIDHGKKWEKADLPGDTSLRAAYLTTVPDSTTLKFLLAGQSGKGQNLKWHFFSIDFSELHEQDCNEGKDFEKWPARVNDDGEPSCLMGHKQFYRRRKADAECFIKEEFKDPVPTFEKCKCSKADYECDYNFKRDDEDRSKCVPVGALKSPDGACKDPKDTFKGSSGYRLIPGNECEGGEKLDEEIDRPCSDTVGKPHAEGIVTEKTNFKADRFDEFYYLERTRSSRGEDETVIMRTSEQEIYKSRDHGKTWEQILKGEPVIQIRPHDYFNDVVYFVTGGKKVFYSIERGDNIRSFEAPDPPTLSGLPILGFHESYKDWILWTGAKDCPGKGCHNIVHYSTDRGDEWKTLVRYSRKCEFIKPEGRQEKEKLVYCEQYQDENPSNPLQLYSSDNWFADSEKHFDDIIGFATMSEFIVVAAQDPEQQSLKADASVDGKTFADAEFPKNFKVPHQSAYTVLDSSTHAVFLHVTVNGVEEHEHGTILKSNSNGTSYVLSMKAVNRDTDGFVDFEKMKGLEGVALVNVVDNMQASDDTGEKKKLKSMITHNDGARWDPIPAPERDNEGRAFGCDTKKKQKCSLHLHSFTERSIKSATFGSPSAVGLMIGVGNVGEYLLRKDDDQTYTFITRNGGLDWKAVMKGAYLWEYGDQGSVIVIVKHSLPTKKLYYTLDEGAHWNEYEFSNVDMQIDALSTVPSDSSMNFLLWGADVGAGGKGGITTVNLDFSGLKQRQRDCEVNEDGGETNDYEMWSPKHPLQDECLFGHVTEYHRKKLGAQCKNGLYADFQHKHAIQKNCSCTRQDFECDYNYERQNEDSCVLVDGYSPPDHSAVCKEDPSRIEYYKPTGYRRIPLTTCQGGRELDKSEAVPCPGKKGAFDQKHALKGAGLFFAIAAPVVAGGLFCWYMVQKWKDGTLQGWGQIRLGDSGAGENPIVAGIVTVVAGAWAVVQALPVIVMSLWRSARGYAPVSRGGGGGFAGGRGGRDTGRPYTDRGAFSARRGDYSGVVADEDELLAGSDDEDGMEV